MKAFSLAIHRKPQKNMKQQKKRCEKKQEHTSAAAHLSPGLLDGVQRRQFGNLMVCVFGTQVVIYFAEMLVFSPHLPSMQMKE